MIQVSLLYPFVATSILTFSKDTSPSQGDFQETMRGRLDGDQFTQLKGQLLLLLKWMVDGLGQAADVTTIYKPLLKYTTLIAEFFAWIWAWSSGSSLETFMVLWK